MAYFTAKNVDSEVAITTLTFPLFSVHMATHSSQSRGFVVSAKLLGPREWSSYVHRSGISKMEDKLLSLIGWQR